MSLLVLGNIWRSWQQVQNYILPMSAGERTGSVVLEAARAGAHDQADTVRPLPPASLPHNGRKVAHAVYQQPTRDTVVRLRLLLGPIAALGLGSLLESSRGNVQRDAVGMHRHTLGPSELQDCASSSLKALLHLPPTLQLSSMERPHCCLSSSSLLIILLLNGRH